MHPRSTPSAPNVRLGFVQMHLAVLLFGFAGLFGKTIQAGPAVITFGRTFFAALALLAGLAAGRTNLSPGSLRGFSALMLSGVLLALHWCAFFQSIQVSSVAVGLLTFATFPLFVTFMEPLFSGERLDAFDVVAAAAVMAGLALVIPAFDFADNVTRGVFWGLLSGLSFAVLSLLNRIHVRRYPPMVVTFYQCLAAAVASAPFAFASVPAVLLKDFFPLVLLGVVCTALAHGLFIAALKHIRAHAAAVITGLEPVYGIILAFVLLGEVPTGRTVPGGAIILGSVFFSMYRNRGTR